MDLVSPGTDTVHRWTKTNNSIDLKKDALWQLQLQDILF